MHLIFDTETTGFPSKDLAPDHPAQAHIVQLACLLLDNQFNEVAQLSTLIYPNNWTISPGAEAVHKISLEKCLKYGVTIENVMNLFQEFLDEADYIVAHNLRFDMQMLQIDSLGKLDVPEGICTMEATTEFCKLVGKIPGKHKWPKLHEAYSKCLGKTLGEKAHDAMVDCRACADIYRWLHTTGRIVVPM